MAKLVIIQNPQRTFHKDEGGKNNFLMFRVLLQGDVDPSVGGLKGEIPLDVEAVFDDGTPIAAQPQEEVLSIMGCTEKPSGGPCLCLVSKLGGVTYRLKQVSKRLDDRGVSIRVSLRGCPEVEPVVSEGTMVFSKRKNKMQREQQQAQEKYEMELKEAQAATHLLVNKKPKLVEHSGASSLYDTSDASPLDEESLLLRRVMDLENKYSERIAALERKVDDLQRQLEDGKTPSPLPPALPNVSRSRSQAAWNIKPETIQSLQSASFLYNVQPPVLRRDTSTDSFFGSSYFDINPANATIT